MWTTERVRSRVAVLLLAVSAVLLAPRVVRAHSAIAGQVSATTGAVLPGVTVEAASPALIEGGRSAVSDSEGPLHDRQRAAWTLPGERFPATLNQSNTCGPSLDRVQQILDGRLVRIGAQIDF